MVPVQSETVAIIVCSFGAHPLLRKAVTLVGEEGLGGGGASIWRVLLLCVDIIMCVFGQVLMVLWMLVMVVL